LHSLESLVDNRIQYNLDLTYAYARLAPGAERRPRPTVVFSSSQGGAANTSFRRSDTLYGRVTHVPQTNAWGCMERQGVNDGSCASLQNWTAMPNADWSYHRTSRSWRATFSPSSFAAGTYTLWWRDGATQQLSQGLRFTLQ
jgi:hypothetical protein